MIRDVQLLDMKFEPQNDFGLELYCESYAEGGEYSESYTDADTYYDWDSRRDP